MKSPNQKQPTTSKVSTKKPVRRTQPDAQAPALPGDLHARIETRAREIYELRIRQGALDDWLLAEQEIVNLKRAKPEKRAAKSETVKEGIRK